MYRKIIIAAIIVFLAILVGMVVLTSGSAKDDTAINFLSNSTLKNGDAVKFQLIDSKGNPIANEEILIEFNYNGTTEKYSISTDSNGTGSLVLNDLSSGKYKVSVSFNGNDKYNPSSAVQAVTVEDESSDSSTQDYSSAQQGTAVSSSGSVSSRSYVSSNDNFDYGGAPSVSANASG